MGLLLCNEFVCFPCCCLFILERGRGQDLNSSISLLQLKYHHFLGFSLSVCVFSQSGGQKCRKQELSQ